MIWEYIQCFKCENWPKNEGVIIHSKLIDYGKKGTYKIPIICYEYEVNGKNYRSQRLRNRLAKPMLLAEANILLAKYPLDKKVMVSYHPKLKRIGVLETDCKNSKHFVWLGLFLFFIFILSVLSLNYPTVILFFKS